MRTIMIYIFFSIFLVYNAKSQEENKTVSITTIGIGKTFEKAKYSSLKFAIEQVYGTYISSNKEFIETPEVLNQIISNSNNNYFSFQTIDSSQILNHYCWVDLEVVISVKKLMNFAQSKGITIDIKDNLFAININKQQLSESYEINVINELVGFSHEILQNSFNYSILLSEPKSIDSENKNWIVPTVIIAKANKNLIFCENWIKKTLELLSLSDYEVSNYQTIKKEVYPITLIINNVKHTYSLRKKISKDLLSTFCSHWDFYIKGFVVSNKIDKYEGIGTSKIKIFSTYKELKLNEICFFNENDEVGIFLWNDEKTLQEVGDITNYNVEPTKIRSKFMEGGMVVYEEDGHGLVMAFADMGQMGQIDAKQICEDLILNGYNDWYLPTKDELDALYINLHNKGLGGFSADWYSSSSDNGGDAWIQGFNNSRESGYTVSDRPAGVRPVRKF